MKWKWFTHPPKDMNYLASFHAMNDNEYVKYVRQFNLIHGGFIND